MQDLPQPAPTVHPYWCFRDELTILDGHVMKGNRVVIPRSMQPSARCTSRSDLHPSAYLTNSLLAKTSRRNHRNGSKVRICQRHGNKRPTNLERQLATTRPMELVGIYYTLVASTEGSPPAVATSRSGPAVMFSLVLKPSQRGTCCISQRNLFCVEPRTQ